MRYGPTRRHVFARLAASLAIAAAFVLPPPALAEATGPTIAIIIDDVGNNLRRGKRAITLPSSVTLAFLPHTNHGSNLAREAAATGRETMIHMPMANLSGAPLGEYPLTLHLSHAEFIRTLDLALAEFPDATGINNHMGSQLTQRRLEMGWFMEEVKKRNLYFIDSRTTPRTVADRVARQNNVPSGSRDVFLDNDPTFYEIDRAFRKLLRVAERRGTAIAIGHPYDVTLDYLERALPRAEADGFRLVPASSLIAARARRLPHVASIASHAVLEDSGRGTALE